MEIERKLFLISAAAIKPEVQDRLSSMLYRSGGKKTVAYTSTVDSYGQNPFVPNLIWEWFEDRDYILKPVALDPSQSLEAQTIVKDADIIVFNGGDPFQLLRLVRETGVDQILIEKVKAGYPYIGSSAAAVLVGPTIEPFLCYPGEGGNISGITDFTGLNLITDIVWPHYKKTHDYLIERLSKYFSDPFRTINNHQAIIYEGNGSEIIGPEESNLPGEGISSTKPPPYSTP